MHTCPDCGQACSCNGDIDDLLDADASSDECVHCLAAAEEINEEEEN
jgi:hypothetical protein